MAYEIKYRSDNEMKDSGIEWLGKIPKEWEVLRNKNIFEHRPKIFNRSDNTTVLSLTIKGVKVKTDLSFGKSTESYIGHQMVKRGELIFTPRDFDATPILSGIAPEDGCISNLYFVLKTNNITTEKYVNYYWWGLKYGYDYFKKQSYGIRYSFNQEQFSIIPFIKPNTIEQQKIANFLDIKTAEFDSIISKKEQLIEKLEEAKKSLISEVVTGKVKIVDGELVDRKPEEMKDSGVEWLGMIPRDWGTVKLKLINEVKDGTHDTPLYVDEDTDTYPLITSRNVVNGELDFTNAKFISRKDHKKIITRSNVSKGDIIMPMIGTVGNPAIVMADREFSIKNVALFKRGKIILNKYLNYLLNSALIEYQLKLFSRGGVQNFVSLDILRNLVVLKNKIDEQKIIVDVLDSEIYKLNNVIAKTKHQITKLKEAKQSLISEAVTGKIDLRDWEIIESGGR